MYKKYSHRRFEKSYTASLLFTLSFMTIAFAPTRTIFNHKQLIHITIECLVKSERTKLSNNEPGVHIVFDKIKMVQSNLNMRVSCQNYILTPLFDLKNKSTWFARAKWTFWMSKLMVPSYGQRRYICKHMVRFYVPIKSWPQWPHILQKPLHKRVDIGHSIPVTSIPVLCEIAEARVW